MRNLRWSLAGLFVCGLPTACADPCIDDGLGQDNCPPQSSASETEGETDSSSNTDTVTATATATLTMTGSQTATDSDTLDGTATETSGGSVWCVDADGDGFGDPDMCMPADEQPPGTVDNDGDCDDGNENTFPGAAELEDPEACMNDDDDDGWGDPEVPTGVDPGTDCNDEEPFAFPGAAPNDDPEACMQDEDGDDWGDDDPPTGADAGTDCDDTNADAFPGAAPSETPPDLCTIDQDGDGWGDANPPDGGGGSGPSSGADCYDTNPDLNPDMLQLTAMTPFQGGPLVPKLIETIDPATAMLSPFITLLTPEGGNPPVNLVTGTLSENGEIFVNDLNTDTLYSVDYGATCMMGTGELAPVGMPYEMMADIVCGLEFGTGGLYGIDHENRLLTFDPATGEITAELPITMGGMPLDINSCGTAFDCTAGRLLVANGIDQSIYSVDETTGEATLLRDLGGFIGGAWSPVGLEWNPVTRLAYLSTGPELYEIDLDDAMAPPVQVGFYGTQVSNLQYLPICI